MMSFPEEIKRQALLACGRCCSICHKYCDINMEVHHIHAQADGGDDSFENAIPLCFDCHARVKQYNPRHPKGNKFSEAELIGHRDHWYELVQKGIGSANNAGEKPVEPITISKTLDSEPENLFRIETGKELLAFASNAAGMEYDYDEPSDEEELDLITNFCSEVQGILDYDALFDAADNIRTAFSLSKEIRKIESHHFWVFCGSASRTVSGGIMPSAPFKVLIIRILRDDNPIIQKIAIEEEKNE